MTVAAIHRPPPPPGRRLSVRASTWASEKSKHITVSVSGEIDACNAKDFAVTVCEAVAGARRVTLDLSDLEFIAFDGVAALHAVNAHLTRSEVPWSVLPGTAVTRVLELCDPERLIPLARPNPNRSTPRPKATLRLVTPA
ncbi:STAS domain-containing protein [Mycobacterium sp. B14F4]|uniref:STAS domain-containing protein n=1 Tax=Mycobacterium sp. B14F4 TaxID=3153565 RepID=UPI00325D50B1